MSDDKDNVDHTHVWYINDDMPLLQPMGSAMVDQTDSGYVVF